jgi:hypothetical protein
MSKEIGEFEAHSKGHLTGVLAVRGVAGPLFSLGSRGASAAETGEFRLISCCAMHIDACAGGDKRSVIFLIPQRMLRSHDTQLVHRIAQPVAAGCGRGHSSQEPVRVPFGVSMRGLPPGKVAPTPEQSTPTKVTPANRSMIALSLSRIVYVVAFRTAVSAEMIV